MQGNIPHLEMKLAILEDEETLTEKEQQTALKTVKKLEALSAELKTYHCTTVDQIEDQDKLTKEQAFLDDHEDKVEHLMEHLEDLVVSTEPVMPHTSIMGNY